MVDGTWPVTVPDEPEMGDYREEVVSNLASFKPDVGPPSVWRRSTIKGTKISASILLTDDERQDFLDWFNDDLGDGALAFAWTNPAYGVSGRYMFDPASPPEFSSIGHNLWRMRFTALKLS